MDNSIVVDNYAMLDRLLKQEREYVLNIIKEIRKTGCNVLLIQKSILRDAVSDLALSYLAKMKIMVVKDIERDEIEFISKAIGAIPIASIEAFSADKLGSCALVEEVSTAGGKVIKMTGVPNAGKFMTVFLRGSNQLVLDEAERSLHDALCVVRSLVKEKYVFLSLSFPLISPLLLHMIPELFCSFSLYLPVGFNSSRFSFCAFNSLVLLLEADVENSDS